ncbi:ABC transporter substrate-binding protein [Brachybacterium sacelli]|uniref:Multiple sugar transport system substrate-binding protein n=1 Tax=Brachybacterium sacelli TaxID=173364 RepID=A0ABS4X1Q7_9MICO|nr:ABC transporter substrate-binding protein [Brachybacterium sacelli]MBP2381669.1 multiple sugar transport system substrate-binding protein [Brachybacterium sacelli]
MPDDDARTTFRRRSVLGATAVMATGLSACSVETGSESGTEGRTSSDFTFEFDADATDSTQLTWMDSGDLKALFIEPVIAEFGEQHPDITTKYDGAGWEQVNQVVPLGIRNGSAPDVFALPENVPPETAIGEDWVRPIDDVIPDFEQWRAGFPETALINGIHVFDGRVYSWPLNSTRRLDITQYISHEAASAAGVEVPVESVSTWEDLRSLAQEITATGTPGILSTADHLHYVVANLANTAGWLGNSDGMNMRTGSFEYSAPEYLEALEFIRSMIEDGSFVPGYLTLKDADARAQFPTGLAGISLNGPWDIVPWDEDHPDFEYTILPLPSPDGSSYTIPYRETGSNMAWLYADSPNTDAAVAVLKFMGTLEGQRAMVELSGGFLVSTIEEANTSADPELLHPQAKKVTDMAIEYMRACPQFEIRNPDAGAVTLQLEPANPGISATIEGILTGQLPDAGAALEDLDARLTEAMEKAFDEARAGGAEVDIGELQFPNWDPARDYSADDYAALGE